MMKNFFQPGHRLGVLLFLFFALCSMLLALESYEWTVMVYICADNSLSDQAYDDLKEMEAIGSSPQVKILVQIDNLSTDSVPYARRYLIEKNYRTLLTNLGELDMADPSVLLDFIRFAKNNYRAKRYFLILWDHGTGWEKSGDRTHGREDPRIARAIIFDNSSGNSIGVSNGELRQVFLNIKEVIGKKVDVLGMDGCAMAHLEVGAEIAQSAKTLLASQALIPWDGFPYDSLLAILVNNPKISQEDFLEKAVDSYVNSYNKGTEEVTLSAIDLERLEKAIGDFKELKPSLLLPGSYQAREAVQTFSDFGPPKKEDQEIDLIHFLALSGMRELELGMRNCVISARNSGTAYKNSQGISIWFPYRYLTFKKRLNLYDGLTFAAKEVWLRFLNLYYRSDDIKPKPVQITRPQIGRNNDVSLYWNRSRDLSEVSYQLTEVTGLADFDFNSGDSLGIWQSEPAGQGFIISQEDFFSPGSAFFSQSLSNLENELRLKEPLRFKDGGLLSFFAKLETEEGYDVNLKVKKDVCYVEVNNGGCWKPIDSLYGDIREWREYRYELPAGEILIRFRYKSDASVNLLGVFIDDIRITRYASRLTLATLLDTTFYIYNLPRGRYFYAVTPIDEFKNRGMVSQFCSVEIEEYALPYSIPAPFFTDCEIVLDYPEEENPRVFIYTLSGELVKEIPNSKNVYWDGRNRSGIEVGTGIYLVLVKGKKFKSLGKICKVR